MHYRLLSLLCALILSALLPAVAQDEGACTAVAAVSPLKTEIGRPVTLTIDVVATSSDFEPQSPQALSIPDWEIYEAQRLELEPQGTKRQWRYIVKLVSWKLGTITIPELEIGQVNTTPLRVEVVRPQGDSLCLTEPKAWSTWRERYLCLSALWGALGGGILALVSAYGIGRAYRNPLRELFLVTRQRLEQVRELRDEAACEAGEFALRSYLGRVLDLSEEEYTLEELATIAPNWAESLRGLAIYKYSSGAESDWEKWSERALEQLHREEISQPRSGKEGA